MSQPSYCALRVVLGFLSLLLAIGGIVMIFSSKPLVMRVFMHPPEFEISTLLLAALKELGGLALMVSVMLFLASRDPTGTPNSPEQAAQQAFCENHPFLELLRPFFAEGFVMLPPNGIPAHAAIPQTPAL